jgi:hypothetical protein
MDSNVRRFRYSIAEMMAAVALVALVAFERRVIQNPLSGRTVTEAMLLLGGLPMANILAAGLLILLRDRWRRRVYLPWLVGFEVVGWTALCLYASIAYHHPDALRETVVHALSPLVPPGDQAFIVAVMATLGLPQLAVALLGGWLNRLFHRDLTTAA